MTKVKFDGFKYYALYEYPDHYTWFPFWDREQGHAAITLRKKFEEVEIGKEYELNNVKFSNCGPRCTAGYPDENCGHCGGYGIVVIISG